MLRLAFRSLLWTGQFWSSTRGVRSRGSGQFSTAQLGRLTMADVPEATGLLVSLVTSAALWGMVIFAGRWYSADGVTGQAVLHFHSFPR